MSKAVMISIQPKWCELIANGKKTIEVRKTKPKLETPFKVYIYCTLQGSNEFFKALKNSLGEYEAVSKWNRENWGLKKGKVIGEFACDEIIVDKTFGHDALFNASSCMSDAEIASYCTNNKMYGWHISDLVIYDKPRELGEFRSYNTRAYFDEEIRLPMPTHEITRPPQSWCYVEDFANE